jgi:hypothetical protein
MSLSLVQSRALLGLEAASVTVEVHLANGLPSFTLVGLAETEVKEARERVRSAIQNAGLEFPNNKRITVNLAPADLPKDSGRFDLPMAMGILAASGQIDNARLAGHEFAGELSLSGELRPVRDALAMALALHTRGVATRLVLPMDSAQEAALVLAGRCTAPGTCWTWCASSWRTATRRRICPTPTPTPPPTTAGHASSPPRAARRRAMRTCATSRATRAPSARWRSRRPAATAC